MNKIGLSSFLQKKKSVLDDTLYFEKKLEASQMENKILEERMIALEAEV